MLIYLMRHGQTTGDIEDRYGGDYEDNLTEEGIKQAQSLASKMVGCGIEYIYCSPRVRAQDTAIIIGGKTGAEIEILEEARERNHYGILTGMVKSEAKEMYPVDVEKVKNVYDMAQNGEGYEDFKERVMSAWETMINSGYGVLGVVSHGGVIRLIFREILKMGEIKTGDCAYALLKVENGEITVEKMDGIEIVG